MTSFGKLPSGEPIFTGRAAFFVIRFVLFSPCGLRKMIASNYPEVAVKGGYTARPLLPSVLRIGGGTDFTSYAELQTHMEDAHPDTFVHCLKPSKSLYFIFMIYASDWRTGATEKSEALLSPHLTFDPLCHNKSAQIFCDLQSLSRSWT